MEQYLTEYIKRTREDYPGFPAATAHEIASAFLAYKFGLYVNAVQECTHALSLIPDSGANAALKKALLIVREKAQNLTDSQVIVDPSIAFSETERRYVAVNLLQDKIDDPATLELDNALTLLYAVAVNTSPDDEEALGEHRMFVIRLLTGYKKALGLV
jgi:hypothetical protein